MDIVGGICGSLLGSFLLMYLMIYIFKNSEHRLRNQGIAISIVFVLLILNAGNAYKSIISILVNWVPVLVSFIICLFMIFWNTNLFRKVKFHKNKSPLKLSERMPSSRIYRRRYYAALVAVVLIISLFVALLIFDFNILYILAIIFGVGLLVFYLINCIKAGVFKKTEPIRRLVLLVNVKNKLMILSKQDNEEKYFDFSKDLDDLREDYFIAPVAKVFYSSTNYEVHHVFMIKTDSFTNNTNLLVNESDLMFYATLITKLKKNLVVNFMVVKDLNGKTTIEEI